MLLTFFFSFTMSFLICHQVIAYGEYQGVKGEKVALPCNSSLWADESVSLVLWYKGMSEVPIYTLDVRDSTISKSRHISSPHLKDRAYFDVSLNPPLLILENLTKNDEGAFRCRVRKHSTLLPRIYRIKVDVIPDAPFHTGRPHRSAYGKLRV